MEQLPKDTFGLHITSSALTAVELSCEKDQLKIVNFARVPLAPNIVEDNCIILDKGAFKEALAKLVQSGYAGAFRSANVILSVPEEKTFVHTLTIPQEHIHDSDFILKAAEDFIPIELNEAVMDYSQINTPSEKKEASFIFVAIQKTIIESLIQILSEMGLSVVFVDVSTRSLLRAVHNRFQAAEGDLMILDVHETGTAITLMSQEGFSFTAVCEAGGQNCVKALKQIQESLPSGAAAELLRNPPSSQDPRYQEIVSLLDGPLQSLAKKILELSSIAEAQISLNLKTIYLMGPYSRLPGLAEFLQKTFPQARIAQKLSYIQLTEDTELYYVYAIGLALRAAIPQKHLHEINLLPSQSKEALDCRLLKPAIIKILTGAVSVLALLAVASGFFATKAYVENKVSQRELQLSLEKSENPYLHRVAQYSQQKTQLELQIGKILISSLPSGELMKTLDAYSGEEIEFTDVNYKADTGDTHHAGLRAKAVSRPATEAFIARLKENLIFQEVKSPLSNLAGKGERFITVDLILDPVKTIEHYKKAPETEEVKGENEGATAPTPSMPKTPLL